MTRSIVSALLPDLCKAVSNLFGSVSDRTGLRNAREIVRRSGKRFRVCLAVDGNGLPMPAKPSRGADQGRIRTVLDGSGKDRVA